MVSRKRSGISTCGRLEIYFKNPDTERRISETLCYT